MTREATGCGAPSASPRGAGHFLSQSRDLRLFRPFLNSRETTQFTKVFPASRSDVWFRVWFRP